ncbi:MAG: hypothetical protein KKH78_04295 [Candidatus Altiarchaeota archaeon]|nr:hypothetical protein [Candidatus Altiarchaeota archaeon]
MNQALKNLEKMFEESRSMFENSTDALVNNKEMEVDIYKTDKNLNNLEIETRRKILEHLSINPQQDIIASFIFVDVVRDLERIGDVSKAIVKLNETYLEKFESDKYTDVLRGSKSKIDTMFDLTLKAFMEADEDSAARVKSMYEDEIRVTLDKTVREIMNDSEITVKKAIAYTLLTRYLRRISGHLTNIASTVASPFDRVRHDKTDID